MHNDLAKRISAYMRKFKHHPELCVMLTEVAKLAHEAGHIDAPTLAEVIAPK